MAAAYPPKMTETQRRIETTERPVPDGSALSPEDSLTQ